MNKSGVPKEPQDDALSDDTTGGRRIPTGRPTRGNVVPSMVFFVYVFVPSREEEFLELFLGCHTSGKEVIPPGRRVDLTATRSPHGYV